MAEAKDEKDKRITFIYITYLFDTYWRQNNTTDPLISIYVMKKIVINLEIIITS